MTTKYSGISFPNSTHVFGRNCALKIYKDKKGIVWHRITKRWLGWIPFNPVILLFPLIDIVIAILLSSGDNITDSVDRLNLIFPNLGSAFLLVVFLLELTAIGVLIYMVLRKNDQCKWHGLEHRLIAAAEHNSIDTAEYFSIISDRCGATYFPTIFVVFVFLTILNTGGFLTLAFLAMFIEAKTFHPYNKIGLRFGRWLQKKYTTDEPDHEMMIAGKEGMKELMEMENRGLQE